MTSKAAAASFIIFSLVALTSGFSTSLTPLAVNNEAKILSRLTMSTESEVDRLRAAAAKAREEYEALASKNGKTVTSRTSNTLTAPSRKDMSVDEIRKIASSIDFANGDASSQSMALDNLVETGEFGLWKSAVRRGPTSSTSAMSLLVPFPVTLESLERRTDGKVTGSSLGIGGDSDVRFDNFKDLTVVVVLGSTVLGILSLAILPPNIGATLCYLFALIPIAFIGVGSVSPSIIAGAIVAFRGGKKEDTDARRERICRHEAGHFLCGYVCGLPVKKYQINSETGVANVEFHSGSTASVELSDADIAHLSVVAMSGSVAEIMAYEKATGGETDLIDLQNCFRRSKEFIGAAKQQDLTRWGALTSYDIIKKNMSKYEALVMAFKENKSLADCVSIIEATR